MSINENVFSVAMVVRMGLHSQENNSGLLN